MRSLKCTTVASVALILLLAGCSSKPSSAPTTPASVTIDTFAGTWISGAAGGGTAGSPCTGVNYTLSKVSDTSATVTYSGTCSGVSIAGTGKGTLSGSVLNWEASGTASRSGVSCPFSFTNSTATPQADGILVVYNGAVCGVAVSGSQVLHRG